MRVWRWHDIARLYFFAIVRSGSRQCGRLFQLLSTDPGLAPYVKHVRFERGCRFWWWCEACQQDSSRDSFNVRSSASALPSLRLISLRYPSLTLYDNLIDHPLPSECPAQSRRTPVHSFQQLTLYECVGTTRFLPDLLSLFLFALWSSSSIQPASRLPNGAPDHPSTVQHRIWCSLHRRTTSRSTASFSSTF